MFPFIRLIVTAWYLTEFKREGKAASVGKREEFQKLQWIRIKSLKFSMLRRKRSAYFATFLQDHMKLLRFRVQCIFWWITKQNSVLKLLSIKGAVPTCNCIYLFFIFSLNPAVCGHAHHPLGRHISHPKRLWRGVNSQCVKFQFWLTFPVNKSQVALSVKL